VTAHLLPEGKYVFSGGHSFHSCLFSFVLLFGLRVARDLRSVYKFETSVMLPGKPAFTQGHDLHMCFAIRVQLLCTRSHNNHTLSVLRTIASRNHSNLVQVYA
jgi:hypothetical protein